MTTKRIDHLTATDFMMMDVHRPMTDAEIEKINPEAVVDKSARPFKIVDSEEEGVGAPHEEEPVRYRGPFVDFPDNVEVLDVNTSQELEVARVLQSAHDNNLNRVFVIGTREEDNDLFVLCSDPDIAEANLMLDRAKANLLDAIYNGSTRGDPRGPKNAA